MSTSAGWKSGSPGSTTNSPVWSRRPRSGVNATSCFARCPESARCSRPPCSRTCPSWAHLIANKSPRQPGQRGDLFAIKCAQLGQVREQGGREHLADSGHRAKQLVAFTPDRGLLDQTGEFVVEPGEPLFQPADVLINTFMDHLGRVSPAVLFGGEHLNQLAAAVYQSFKR